MDFGRRDTGTGSVVDKINRRNVLQTVGAATAAGVGIAGLTGSASAHRIFDHVFCGCTQVCACGKGLLDILILFETDTGFDCRWERINEDGGEYAVCFEVEDDEKVAAIKPGEEDSDPGGRGGPTICNPNEHCSKLDNAAQPAFPGCVYKCDEVGNSPRDGKKCGGAFLKGCTTGGAT